jgi:hypothetical protein
LIQATSCDFSEDPQVFDFPSVEARKEFSYIKLVGQGNSMDDWNYFSELKIFGSPTRDSTNLSEPLIIIYPNPADKYINISMWDEQAILPDFVRIFNLSGKIVHENELDNEINDHHIPINLGWGVYILEMSSGSSKVFIQKLIVIKQVNE